MSSNNDKDQDLNSLLSPEQRADFTLLIAEAADKIGQQLQDAFVHKDPPASSKVDLEKLEEEKKQMLATDPTEKRSEEAAFEADPEQSQAVQQVHTSDPGSTPDLDELAKKTRDEFTKWKIEVTQRIGEVINSAAPYDEKMADKQAKLQADTESVKLAEDKYKVVEPGQIQNTLKDNLTASYRVLLLKALLLLLLSLETYRSYSRTLLRIVAASLEIPHNVLAEQEKQVAQALVKAAEMSAEEERKKRQEQSSTARRWKVGLASVAGGVLVGVTGGLAAPFLAMGIGSVMGGIGLGATATAGYLGAMAASGVLVGGLFGGYGAKMAGKHMTRYAEAIKDFAFRPLAVNSRLHVTIAITGWLTAPEEVTQPWTVLNDDGDQYTLQWEMEALQDLGTALVSMAYTAAFNYVKTEIIRRTVFAALMTALWPIGLLKAAKVLDNPWKIAFVRAQKAGEVLADAIINKSQGERPVNLIGFSLGSRVIYSCLQELARRGALNLVEDVYMIGTPAPAEEHEWRRMRAVVGGRLVNVFSRNDYILAFLYRTNSVQYGVAGLQPIETVNGVENVDVSDMVEGHLRYRWLVGKILERCGAEDLIVESVDEQAGKADMVEMEQRLKNSDKSSDQVIFDTEQELDSRRKERGDQTPEMGDKTAEIKEQEAQ